MVLAVILVALLRSLNATTHHEIVSDVRWNDTDGNSVEAHGGCVLRSPLDGIWYLYGETKRRLEPQDASHRGLSDTGHQLLLVRLVGWSVAG